MRHTAPAPTPAEPGRRLRPSWSQTFSALQYPNFRLLWSSTLLVSGGNWVQQVTLGWLAYRMSESALHVALVSGMRALPLLMAPLAGTLADRVNRRKLLLVNQGFLALAALGFALLVMSGHLALWHLYVFSGVTGAGWSLNNPVRQTLVSSAVPPESLMNAIALNSMAFNFTRVFGPAAGGFLIVFFGPGLNFLIQAVFYLGVMALVFPFKPTYETDYRAVRKRSVFSNIKEGFNYVAHEPTARAVVLMALIPTLTMMSFVMSLQPVYAAEVLGDVGARSGGKLGLLLTASGFGGFIGTFLMATFSHVRQKGVMVLVGLVGTGVGIIGLSQVSVLWMAMLVMVFINVFQMTVMTANQTVIQMTTPDRLRGRVMGVYMMDMGMMPLGGLMAGFIAERWNVPTAYLAGSISGLVLVVVLTLANPRLLKIRI